VLFYDAAKARAAVGWKPRDGEAVLVDALRWLVHLGLVDGGAFAPECRVPDPGWRR